MAQSRHREGLQQGAIVVCPFVEVQVHVSRLAWVLEDPSCDVADCETEVEWVRATGSTPAQSGTSLREHDLRLELGDPSCGAVDCARVIERDHAIDLTLVGFETRRRRGSADLSYDVVDCVRVTGKDRAIDLILAVSEIHPRAQDQVPKVVGQADGAAGFAKGPVWAHATG